MHLRILFVTLLVHCVVSDNFLDLDKVRQIELNRDARITYKCLKQLEEYQSGLLNGAAWAWNMFDASAKFPFGILAGNNVILGNYEQCIKIKQQTDDSEILGKYCLAGLNALLPINITTGDSSLTKHNQIFIPSVFDLPNVTQLSSIEGEVGHRMLKLAICVPSACTPTEVYDAFKDLFGISGLPVAPYDDKCETTEDLDGLKGSDIAFITFLAIIIVLNVASSIYDARMQRLGKKPASLLFVAFSGLSHFRKIVADNTNPNHVTCLDGLRVFSICWVILGHRFSITQIVPYSNYDYFEEWKPKTYAQYAQGAASAVDTFLFLSGLLLTQAFIRSQSKPNAKFNIILFYIHRYLRLTPAMAVLYFLHVSVFTHLGSGPLWTSMVYSTKTKCLKQWAPYFFYFQNYVDSNKMCLLHTWYLSMDMQMFILTPLVLIPLVRFRKIMMKFGFPILILLSIICPFVITYVYETAIMSQDYYDLYYYPVHTRFSSMLVGMYAGALLDKYKHAKLDMHWALHLFIWACVVVGMVACVFCGNSITYNYERLPNAFYIALHRPMWCVGLTWVVFSCMKGRGGIFNWVLSIHMFQTLSKVTYSIYLVHITVLLLDVGKVKFPGEFADLPLIHVFLGDLVTSATLGIIWSILFESPMIIIEKVIFGIGGPSKKPEPISPPENVKIDEEKL